jgi:hypothetical protein
MKVNMEGRTGNAVAHSRFSKADVAPLRPERQPSDVMMSGGRKPVQQGVRVKLPEG